jgi:O-antigen ligase
MREVRSGAYTASVKFGALEYGFWAFLLIAVGRIGELIPGLGSFPLAKITLALPLVIGFVQRKRLPGLAVRARPIARTAMWLAVLAVLLTPVSVWPGASFAFLYLQLPVLAATVSIAYVMSRSWRSVRGTLLALVIAGTILAGAALSGYSGRRAVTDTMYDPNDLAYLLVTVFPLAVGFLVTSKTVRSRAVHLGVAATLLIALLLTQSRGGFLGLLAVVGFMIFVPIRAPETRAGNAPRKRRGKIGLLVGVAALSALVWSQLPQNARERFSTLLHLSHDYNLDPTDVTARGQIWKRGIEATVARPIGYGPDTFPMVDWKYGGHFYAPHNSFIQLAVELGIVGLFLLLRMYALALRGLQHARRHLITRKSLSNDQEEQVVFARMLQCSLVANAIAGFFLTMAYASVLWTIVGVCMAVMALTEHAENGCPDVRTVLAGSTRETQ